MVGYINKSDRASSSGASFRGFFLFRKQRKKGERERAACALGADDNCRHVGWHGGAVWSYSAGKWLEARLKKTLLL